jgi:DtxR family transcriptional regulator, Mn-dependent transcriptional regulator
MATQAVEMYLLTIYRLGRSVAPVRPARLAQRLGVSPASVAQMLKRLEKDGLVSRTEELAADLTPEGKLRALALVRRHRLWERFLHDILGLPLEMVHDQACQLEHATSGEAEERLDAYLHNPRTCPHGHPIPTTDGRVETPATCSLGSLGAGDGGTIVEVAEEEPEMVRYLATLGLLPQTRVEVEEVAPFNGPVLVRVGRSRYALGRAVAEQIQVARGA